MAIPVESLFNTFEFWYPYYRLKEAGAEVVVAGSGSAERYTGKPGTEVKVDVSIDQVSASDFDAIVIAGVYADDHRCDAIKVRSPARMRPLALKAAQRLRLRYELPIVWRRLLAPLRKGRSVH